MSFISRRLQVWTIVLVGIIFVLVAQSIFPQLNFTHYVSKISPPAVLAIFLAALFCEYIDSSLGMGYGTTLTPMLMIFGFEPLQIVPCILLSELLTGFTSAVMHHRDGNVDLLRDPQARSAVITLSLLSAVGAIAAVTLALRVPKVCLNTIIGIIIISAGIITILTVGRKMSYRKSHLIIIGTIASFNKGLSGGGYGPLVTSGQVVSGLSAKKAVAITSLTESVTCLVGLCAYLLMKNTVDWSLAAPLTIGALLSVPVATLTVRHLPEKVMKISVGVATFLLGMFILIKMII